MGAENLIDTFGQAIIDHYKGINAIIDTYSSVGGWDELPVSYLFRSFEAMPGIEKKALQSAYGSVLDLGCGAGSHSLYLQQQGLKVKPIDISKGAIEVCILRGLKSAEVIDFWKIKNQQFDTICSLMNGAGICGRISRMPQFLAHLKTLLNPGGQILLDSSDIIYMFEDEQGNVDLSAIDHYYGDVTFQTSYQGSYSGKYPWLYIDFYNLQELALLEDLHCELIFEGPHYDYLARLTIKNQ